MVSGRPEVRGAATHGVYVESMLPGGEPVDIRGDELPVMVIRGGFSRFLLRLAVSSAIANER